MTDFTMTMLVLNSAHEAKLLPESEFKAAMFLLKQEDRLNRLVEERKELLRIIEELYSAKNHIKIIELIGKGLI